MSLRDDLTVWARSEGLCWIFIFKMLAAALTTLWLAMRLDMPQPSTAVMAVFIVMQPQSGQVIAKSLHRLLGTVIGLLAMLPLIALFNQEPVLFLGGMALWVALCTAGAARYRDLRSYSCLLAGYTATLVSLTAIQHPQTAFIQALWRVLEIGLGVLCCSVFSAAILPQSTGSAMRQAVARRFGDFAALAVTHLHGGDRATLEAAQARLAAQTVRLETLRSMSGYDDPQLALRMGRLSRLNHDFMAIGSRFHALQQLLARLRSQGASLALDAFVPCLDSLSGLLAPWQQRTLDERGAAELATQLEDYRARLLPLIRQCRAGLGGLPADSPLRLDFDTAAELLYRLADDLHDYAQTHAALAPARHERERGSERFAPRANRLAVGVAALRMLLLIGLGSALWLQSAWPSGHMFLITAVIIGSLCSASANPARMALQMAGGTFLAALFGFVESFLLFPRIGGFPMLALALAPVFLFGLYLVTRPRWAGYGLGLLILFGFGTLPANFTVHDPASLLNNYIALVLSQLLVAVVMACVLPPNRPWMWRHLERDLRRRVVHAVRAPLAGLPARFDSSTRDLLTQAHDLAAGHPAVQRDLLRWMTLVLEIGHAVIELRQEKAALPDESSYAAGTSWRLAFDALAAALVRLFARPTPAHLSQALARVERAIDAVRRTPEARAPHFASSPLRRLESYLHFIRTALLDPHSPLAERLPGAAHAA
ncbi:FUSC family protein [Pseudomonas sp. AN-1]|uniref:FUSC family protein n=1 Tax=Pseudomonas sp. AN-1 TaxID=3096605 RepID=UPI002A6AFEBC|nr:FUSC family protein [Pseudomonas sp. AN-1]WPP45144.1 FUSC family protein [Pseudomonas sp. AN-1]